MAEAQATQFVIGSILPGSPGSKGKMCSQDLSEPGMKINGYLNGHQFSGLVNYKNYERNHLIKIV